MTLSTHSENEKIRWQAIIDRDPTADGTFLYGVRTTGIYCRPTCPSRRPLRKNILFFATAADAEHGGYRPCKKCAPSKSGPKPPPQAVLQACRLIDEAEEPPTLALLAEAVDLSPHYLHRLFKRTLGITPKAYAATQRAERFRSHLRHDGSITAAIYEAGYGASSRCYEESNTQLGMTPTAYRKGGDDETVYYAVAPCSLGNVAVAATRRGLCMVALGDDPQRLREDVCRRFPKAQLEEDDPDFLRLVDDLLTSITTPHASAALPLDIQGTAFQRQVWEALREIPVGRTATYSDIAQVIGRPSGSRAVARACASNNIAIAIPCHRVVRKDGQLSGYRWGVDRKRELLRREAEGDEEGSPKQGTSYQPGLFSDV